MSISKYNAIQNIVSVFETGRVLSPEAYATLAVLPDGAGFSYGIHQSTDRSDSLDMIVLRYIDSRGDRAGELGAFLKYLYDDSTTRLSTNPAEWPRWATDFARLLQELGREDPMMQLAQRTVFDENYWHPALAQCAVMKLRLPLSTLVVYDTCIQSGPSAVARMRKLFAAMPPSRGGDEKEWTQAYVRARRDWLAKYPNAAVQRSVYRMDAVQELIDAGQWELTLPLRVRGVTIDSRVPGSRVDP